MAGTVHPGKNKKHEGPGSLKKLTISLLCSVGIFIISWFYQNCPYTIIREETFFNQLTLFRYGVFHQTPNRNKQIIFIDTGNDLSLVDDSSGYGNIQVSDRFKLLKLLTIINHSSVKPKFVLVDLQFNHRFKYTLDSSVRKKIGNMNLANLLPDTTIDDSIQKEIDSIKNIAISTSVSDTNKIIYKAAYGIVDYRTFGSNVNKFRVNYPDLGTHSLPSLLHEKVDTVVYTGFNYLPVVISPKCKYWLHKYRLSFNYIWPQYYYDEKGIKNDPTHHYEYYRINNFLDFMKYFKDSKNYFKNKIVFIGNFSGDMHDTPLGKMPGTIVLFDIYLSLLNGNQYLPALWVLFIIVAFSILSYKAIYREWPYAPILSKSEKTNKYVHFFNKWVDKHFLTSLIKHYILRFKNSISFMFHLILVSMLSLYFFNINICLFPAFIFIILETIIEKWEEHKVKKTKS